MNRIYKTLWSASTQSWQAVPENARTGGKKSTSSAAGVVASVALGFALSGAVHAQSPPAINQLPTGGSVARGTATFSQTATAQAAAMTVTQSSQRAVINWDTFNLGSKASVNFVQPNAQAVTLNRVNDSNPSQIFGRITANGQVFLTNANGVYFSPTSSVDVGAFTATTHSISDDNFMSGKYVFERNGATGKVVNEGNINAALGGYVALLAPEVQNAGVVVAKAGTVAMAAGEMITLTVDNNGSLAGITTTPSTIATLIENKHAVLAPDGQIILSAVALDKLQAGVIKNSGSLEANSISHKGGKIYLEGDDITLSSTSRLEAKGPAGGGTVLVGGDWQGSGDLRQATKVTMEAGASIDASATDKGDGGKVVLWSDVHNADSVTRANGNIKAEAGPNGGDGGKVETSGHLLKVDGIQVSTKALAGKFGDWLLDPYNVYIKTDSTQTETYASNAYTPSADSSIINNLDLQTQLNAGNVEVLTSGAGTTQTGIIFVQAPISWNQPTTLKLSAARYIIGSADIAINHAGGQLVLNQTADNSTYPGQLALSSVISGSGSVKIQGAVGSFPTLTGASTYSGGTIIDTGGLVIDRPSVFNASGALVSSPIGTGSLTLNSGAILDINRTNYFGLNVNLNLSNNIFVNGASKISSRTAQVKISGVIADGATPGQSLTLEQYSASGSLEIAGNNTHTGATTLSNPNGNGTIKLSHPNALGTTGQGTTITGVTLQLSGGISIDEPISASNVFISSVSGTNTLTNAITMTGNVTLSNSVADTSLILAPTGGATAQAISLGTSQLTVTGISGVVIAGAITGTDPLGTLSKSGTGTLTLSGANTFVGTIMASGGTLAVTHADGLGTTAGRTTLTSGATLDLQGVAVSEPITLSGGTLATSTGTSSLSGAVSLQANSTVNVSGTSLTLSGVVSGNTKALTKSGSGTLVLAAANTYGSTTLSAGTLRLAHSTALGGTGITVPAGTTLELGAIDGSNLNVSGKTITLESGSTYGGGGYLHNVAGLNTWSGAITLQNNSTITVDTGTSLNLSSASSTVASGALVSFKPNDGILTFGTLTGSGGAGYVTTGTGALSGNFVGLSPKTLIYARPVDASNLNSSYYGSDPVLTLAFYATPTGGTQYNLVSGTDYTGSIVYSGAPTATSAPGNYTISYASGATVSNAAYYLMGASSSLAWTVAPKPLTITVGSSSKTYDGQAFSGGSVTYGAFANGQNASVLSGTLTYGGTSQGAINVSDPASPYTITASGLSSTNYAITYVAGSLSIDKKPLTVSAPYVTKVYDGTTSATGVATVGALATGDAVNNSAVIAFTDKNVGANNKTVRVSGLTIKDANNVDMTGNYAITYADNTTSTITAKELTVTADDALKNFGSPNPAFNVTVSGYVPGETAATSGVTGAGLATTTATNLTVAGAVPITASVGTLAATNYAFTRFVDGTLTIKPIAAMNNVEVSTLIGYQLLKLTGPQIASFSATQLQVFSPQQLSSLSPSQLAAMTTAQVLALSPVQMAAIGPAKIAGLSATELGAFSNAQLQALSVSQIAAIEPSHFAALSPEQIMALSISQVINLTPDQLKSFSPAQVASLSAAEIAYFDARQLAAIGIVPKAETSVPPAIATSNQLPLNFEAPSDSQNKFQAAIPVMTDVARANAPATPTAASTQPVVVAPVVAAVPKTGVLVITILSNAEARPTTAGVAFEQDASGVRLRITSAPPMALTPTATGQLAFNDKLTTFMVAAANGDMVEFQGSLVNKRLVIVAPNSAAKQVARTEMNVVLAAAITSLGAENRVMLANLDGVVIDLR